MVESDFDKLLQDGDLRLFRRIESQSSAADKKSLLACQLAARNLCSEYVYLEIGSHLGGSIQPFLLDERCARIYSIDKRPAAQPDERGVDYVYKNNSTARMLENLRRVGAIEKIVCFDSDAADVDRNRIEPRPNFCFIDGEHTDAAAWRDFRFCYDIAARDALILFHDAWIIYNALHEVVEFLKRENCSFKAYNLPDVMFAIEIGDFPVHREPAIYEMLINNHAGYLASLRSNDFYRRFANKPVLRHARRLRSWLARARTNE